MSLGSSSIALSSYKPGPNINNQLRAEFCTSLGALKLNVITLKLCPGNDNSNEACLDTSTLIKTSKVTVRYKYDLG